MQRIDPSLFSLSLILLLSAFSGFEARGGAEGASSRAVTSPPNIVFILADDMGYGDPRCYNPESKIATPHIDSLARDGMRFTDAHAPGPWCIPSRYGLLTGQYPMRAKFAVNKRASIAEGRVTIASLLKAHGYATAMVGKWHLGFDRAGGVGDPWAQPLRGGPVDVGFDSFFGIPESLDIPPYYYIRDRHPVAPPTQRIAAKSTPGWSKIQGEFWRAGGIAPGFVHEEVLPRLRDEAVAYIDTRGARRDAAREQPFFLYLALTAPHTPWLPSTGFRGKSRVELYGDFVEQVDAVVGDVLDALDRNGMARDTLVVFSSDNGPVWYPKDVARFGHRSVGRLRGMKSDAWEGGHRMPFLARWPARIAKAGVSRQTICFTDMLATFAEIVGADLPAAARRDSVSVLPLMLGDERSVRETTILHPQATVVRRGRWKLITHLGSHGFSSPRRVRAKEGGPRGQLYDLEADPSETSNLWLQKPALVEELLEARRAAMR